jgi:hypothetical protein
MDIRTMDRCTSIGARVLPISLFCVNEERLSRLQEEMPKISLERYKLRLAHSFLLTTF